MSDSKVNVSGVTNSAINAGGTVHGNVTNNVQIRGLQGKEEKKTSLLVLMQQVEDLVAQLPPENNNDAQKIIKRLKGIISEIENTEPDKEDIEFNLESLQKAAKNVAALLPSLFPIATEIASRIRSMLP